MNKGQVHSCFYGRISLISCNFNICGFPATHCKDMSCRTSYGMWLDGWKDVALKCSSAHVMVAVLTITFFMMHSSKELVSAQCIF